MSGKQGAEQQINIFINIPYTYICIINKQQMEH